METKQKRTKVKVSVLALVVLVLCINGLAEKGYCQEDFTLENLAQIIDTLPDDVLSDEVKNSLVSKVNNALKSVDKEKDEAAINVLRAFINQVETQRGKKISEETADMLIGYANNLIAQIEINLDLNIEFANTQGTGITGSDGTTYMFTGYVPETDPTKVYPEEYWGEYPLYLAGDTVLAGITVTYNGLSDQVNMSVITEASALQIDGSNGDALKTPATTDFTLNNGETKNIAESFTLASSEEGLSSFCVSASAKHIARDIVKEVKQNVSKRRGRIISKRVRKAISEWKSKDAEINFDLGISFNSTDGTCIANVNGLTYIYGGAEYLDPTLVYAEEYWGEYPLYFPGDEASIVVKVTYNGPADQVNMSVVTETYIMELDGSNGAPIDGPDTTDFTVNKGETKLIDSSFILPQNGKGLNRIIVKVYNNGNLLMAKEGIFCPPYIAQ